MANQHQPLWLTNEEMTVWRGLIELMHDVESELDAQLAKAYDFGIHDYQVLVLLSEAPSERMRMCDLAARLQVSPSGLTRRLDGLVRRKFVGRTNDPADRRVVLAELTDEGRAALEIAAPLHVAGVREQFIDLLTPTQKTALARIVRSLEANRSRTLEPK